VDPHRGRLQVRKASFRDYREDSVILGPTGGAAPRSRGKLAPQARHVFRSLDKVVRSLPRSSGIVDKVSGPTCRSARLLAGRVHLTGTSGTLVGGDPWVPMSLTFLWTNLLNFIRSKGKIALDVASSGIAALLLPFQDPFRHT
jgi:hypothetical protein